MRILLVTNDFPPRVGGIQGYLANIYGRLAASHEITVLAPAFPGDVVHDRAQRFEMVRWPTRVYWPASSLEQRVRELAAGKDLLAFGAVLPMNVLGRRVGLPYVVHTHGFEVAWARVPALLQLLRRIGRGARLVTVVSDYTARFIERALGSSAPRIELLKTGVDLERFHPSVDGGAVRKRHGLGARPVVVCVSRLVTRKGQDKIIKALRLVHREVPDAAALLVGGGPARPHLERLARDRRIASSVVFTGEVREAELAQHYAAGDVFAMPARSRWGGLEVEGLGLVYLEAQACGRPAIAGDSGGAPEAVLPGETGFVVRGDDHRQLAEVLVEVLSDPPTARRMGDAGRTFVEAHHHWDRVAERFRVMLESAAR